jgi:hypothetical protein
MRVVSCGRGYKVVRNPVRTQTQSSPQLISMIGKGKSEIQKLILKNETPQKYVSFR